MPDIEPLPLLQPQPIGIHSGAAAHLILPFPDSRQDNIGNRATLGQLQSLLLGELDIDVPAAWTFFLQAAAGDNAAAITTLQSMLDDSEPERPLPASDAASRQWLNQQVIEYNLFALAPSLDSFNRLSHMLEHQQIRRLLQLTGFAYGLSEELPDCERLPSELRAWGFACQAAAAMESESWETARRLLDEAVALVRKTSPVFAASLLGQVAQVLTYEHASSQTHELSVEHDSVIVEQVLSAWEQAIECASHGHNPRLLAELYSQLGMWRQRSAGAQRHQLLACIRAYQMALQVAARTQLNPLLLAEIQSNLALAYLAIPETGSSAQLRTGIAIQSFRRAIENLDPVQHGDAWARISMNLANALQYAPSSHPAENLIQSVEIYEQVLQVRTRARDPVAYAWVVYNQANALAHLGVFKDSLEKGAEAYKLFQWYEQAEGAEAARELVHQVSERLVDTQHDLNKAIDEELQHGNV